MINYRGIALIPVLVATSVIGVAIPASIALVTACTTSNGETAKLTQAISLANNLMEFAMVLPITDPGGDFQLHAAESQPKWDNLYDLHNRTFSPPIDSSGNTLTQLSGWQEDCTIAAVYPATPGVATPPTNDNARLLTVNVRYKGRLLYTATRMIAPTLGLNP